MTRRDDRHSDPLDTSTDSHLARWVADLDDTCATLRLPAQRDAAIARTLLGRAAEQHPCISHEHHALGASWLFAPWRQTRHRLLSVVLPIVVVLGGIMGLLRLQAPTPASAAQVVLRHAAAAWHAVSPDQAIHATYTITTPGGVRIAGATLSTATLDDWLHRDTSGALTEAAMFSTATGTLLSHTILTGQTATTYNTVANTVQTGALAQASSALAHPFDAEGLAQTVSALSQGADQTAQLLTGQTLNGHPVDVVEINQTDTEGDTTPRMLRLYVDAQTYILRRLDVTTGTGAAASTSTVQLVQYASVPLAAVPAHTFTLDAPATARTIGPVTGPQRKGTQELSVIQALALSTGPALLLSGPIDGLRLHQVLYTRQPQGAVVNYVYRAGRRDFDVTTGAIKVDPMLFRAPGTPQSLTLTVAGQTVHAAYYAPAPTTHVVLYTRGTTGLRIVGVGLSKAMFLQATQALIDARSHPSLVAQAEHDLDASRGHRTQ